MPRETQSAIMDSLGVKFTIIVIFVIKPPLVNDIEKLQEVGTGVEPVNSSFADYRVTTSPPNRKIRLIESLSFLARNRYLLSAQPHYLATLWLPIDHQHNVSSSRQIAALNHSTAPPLRDRTLAYFAPVAIAQTYASRNCASRYRILSACCFLVESRI